MARLDLGRAKMPDDGEGELRKGVFPLLHVLGVRPFGALGLDEPAGAFGKGERDMTLHAQRLGRVAFLKLEHPQKLVALLPCIGQRQHIERPQGELVDLAVEPVAQHPGTRYAAHPQVEIASVGVVAVRQPRQRPGGEPVDYRWHKSCLIACLIILRCIAKHDEADCSLSSLIYNTI